MRSCISSVKSTSTGLHTNMFGNIGCRLHGKIDEEPMHTGANMDLSCDVPAAQDVADNLEGDRHKYDLQEAPNN